MTDLPTTPRAAMSLRQRMIEDMAARLLKPGTQRGYIRGCKRFAAFLKRSPETATAEDISLFQLHLVQSGASICSRNQMMVGVGFLLRVTLRRHDLAEAIFYVREPKRIPLVMSQDEIRRLLAMARGLKARAVLSLGYGCGLRAGEVVRLRAGDIDTAQMIIRVEQGSRQITVRAYSQFYGQQTLNGWCLEVRRDGYPQRSSQWSGTTVKRDAVSANRKIEVAAASGVGGPRLSRLR